jgi:hypothetical protein
MIYTLVGTDTIKRNRAKEELSKLGKETAHLYSESISLLLPLIQASSLFGDKVVVALVQTMDVVSSREEVVRLLGDMKASENIFIIDEPFADANRVTRLTKFSEKVYDAREAKKEKVDVFVLGDFLIRRDKKNAWLYWTSIRNQVDSMEALAGALWWKFSMHWGDVRKGKPSKFTQKECEVVGGRLAKASLLAHRGQLDLEKELESILLLV